MENKISIIIPTYNRGKIIRETLDSIINQTYKNWECIIVDDGSTDNTDEIITNYIKKDDRFKYYHRPEKKTKGANSCRNFGFEKSSGKYIKFFDSDDIMKPDFLFKQVDILNKNNNIDFCACLTETFIEETNKTYINGANRNPKHSILVSYFFKNLYFFTGSPLWRKKELIKEPYIFDPKLKNADETDFHFRILLNNPKFIYTDDVLFSIRRGHKSITQSIENKIDTTSSRYRYFSKCFYAIKEKNIIDKEILSEYLLYRILTAFNGLINSNIKFENKEYIKLLKLIINSPIKLKYKTNFIIGLFLTKVTKKGYRFFLIKTPYKKQIIN